MWRNYRWKKHLQYKCSFTLFRCIFCVEMETASSFLQLSGKEKPTKRLRRHMSPTSTIGYSLRLESFFKWIPTTCKLIGEVHRSPDSGSPWFLHPVRNPTFILFISNYPRSTQNYTIVAIMIMLMTAENKYLIEFQPFSNAI